MRAQTSAAMFDDARTWISLTELHRPGPTRLARRSAPNSALNLRSSSAALDENVLSESAQPEGPAGDFRDAVTEGANVWGPILGGVVVAGGGMALVGTLLVAVDSSAPNAVAHA